MKKGMKSEEGKVETVMKRKGEEGGLQRQSIKKFKRHGTEAMSRTTIIKHL